MTRFHHLLTVIGAFGAIVAVSMSWWRVELTTGNGFDIAGSESQPLGWSLLLVAGAAYAASLLLSRVAHRIVLLLGAAAGVGATIQMITQTSIPWGVISTQLALQTGVAGQAALDVVASVEPTGVGLVGALASACIALGLGFGASQIKLPPGSSRYERGSAKADPDDSAGAWDALSEGEDPTL
jgi:hypothetical protein